MAETDIGDVFGNMAVALKEACQCGRQLGVDEEAHGVSACDKHRVVALGGSVFKAGLDVGKLEIGEVFENFGLGHTGGEEVEHVLNPDAHPTDAGTSSTLIGIECDAAVHGEKLDDAGTRVKGFLATARRAWYPKRRAACSGRIG
jgi:hypothetical protein